MSAEREGVDELIERIHEAVGHGLEITIATHRTEPRIVIEYDSTRRRRVVGESLEAMLRAILEFERDGEDGPVTLEIDLDDPG